MPRDRDVRFIISLAPSWKDKGGAQLHETTRDWKQVVLDPLWTDPVDPGSWPDGRLARGGVLDLAPRALLSGLGPPSLTIGDRCR
jgi:hypothetical protein